MTTKVQKWGNSLAVRLPQEVAQSAALKAGSEVMITRKQRRIIIEQTPPRKSMGKNAWKKFVLPVRRKKKENVSKMIDQILYGAAS